MRFFPTLPVRKDPAVSRGSALSKFYHEVAQGTGGWCLPHISSRSPTRPRYRDASQATMAGSEIAGKIMCGPGLCTLGQRELLWESHDMHIISDRERVHDLCLRSGPCREYIRQTSHSRLWEMGRLISAVQTRAATTAAKSLPLNPATDYSAERQRRQSIALCSGPSLPLGHREYIPKATISNISFSTRSDLAFF